MDATTTAPAATPLAPVDLAELVQRIGDISTLPQVARKVIDVAGKPDAGAAELRVVLESDPALSARVLRCVNSAAYGLRSKITNLQLAISYLGFKEIRNLAMAASVSHVFKVDEQVGPYRRGALWRHLVAVAIASRMVAQRVRMANFEEVFLAGLLHDIGIVFIDQYCHDRFELVMRDLPPDAPLTDRERAVLGFDHTELGSRIAEHWSFPEPVAAAVRYHHACHLYTGESSQIVCAVELGNLVCTLKGIPAVLASMVRPTVHAMHRLGLSREDVKVLAADLDRQLELNRELFVI